MRKFLIFDLVTELKNLLSLFAVNWVEFPNYFHILDNELLIDVCEFFFNNI